MWTCTVCGRTFQKQNQSHSCGIREESIEAYIANQNQAVQPLLTEVHQAILAAIPDVEQRMSWGMPTYWKDVNLLHMSAAKKHIGVYAGKAVIEHFKDELAPYPFSNGTLQLPYDKPLPLELVARIARYAYETKR